jgi:hypothetical protein
MAESIDDTLHAWCQTSKALYQAFLYDNLLPIYEIIGQVDRILADVRCLCTLSQKARSKPLNVKEQVRFAKLLRNQPEEKLEKIIEQLNLLRKEWSQDQHPVNNVIEKLKTSPFRTEWHDEQLKAKNKELANAELLCRRLLEELKSALSGIEHDGPH